MPSCTNTSRWHADDLARQFQITQEDQDQWTLRPEKRFVEALAAGSIEGEIVPVRIQNPANL